MTNYDNIILKHLTLGSLKHGLCRICLSERNMSKLVRIFDERCLSSEYKLIKDILEDITSVQMRPGDGFPEVVCRKCLEAAMVAFRFKRKFEQADLTLKNCINVLYKEIVKIKELGNDTNSSDTVLLMLPENEIFLIERNNLTSNIGFQDSMNKSERTSKNFNKITSMAGIIKKPKPLLLDCTMCRASFLSKQALKNHKTSHPVNARHVCRICKKTYKRLEFLKTHMVKHQSQKNCTCPLCKATFFYSNSLQNHLLTHKDRPLYTCNDCGKKYAHLLNLEEHIRIEHLGEKYGFMCDECGTLLKSENCLKSHTKIHNHKDNAHVCQYCSKTYHSQKYYRNHLLKHQENVNGDPPHSFPSKKFICDYCSEEHKLKDNLKRHILIVHLDMKNFKCEKCGKAFRSKGNLREHRVVHTRERSIQCDVCGSTLVNKKALKLHQRLHTGEKPYPCKMCKETFISSSRRDSHFKSKHMDKQEECSICFKKYYFKSSLKHHMLSHSILDSGVDKQDLLQ